MSRFNLQATAARTAVAWCVRGVLNALKAVLGGGR
jgi:hypothetical protein